MADPVLVAGQKVLYSPDLCHALERDLAGEYLFHWHYDEDAPGRHKKGDLADLKTVGQLSSAAPPVQGQRRHQTAQGHIVRAGAPKAYWQATVVRVNADGSADLEVQHPSGFITYHCPARDLYREEVASEVVNPDGTITRTFRRVFPHANAPGIKHDPKKGPHSFHLEGE